MRFRDGQHEGLFEQDPGGELFRFDRQRQQPGVEAALAQHIDDVLGLFLEQSEGQARESFAYFRHHVRQKVRREGRENADSHGTGVGILAAPGDGANGVGIGQHGAGAFDDFLADLGEHDLARRAFHQLYVQLFLELSDLGAEGGLADVAKLCGLAEMAHVGQGDKIMDGTKIHLKILSETVF